MTQIFEREDIIKPFDESLKELAVAACDYYVIHIYKEKCDVIFIS
jgi:predicted aldo/keto reductase-like oxidoreductase